MKSIIAKLFGLYTMTEVEDREKSAAFRAVAEKQDKDEEERKQIRSLCIEVDVGNVFISVTNEWDNPLIGIVLGVEYVTAGRCPIAKVYDFITNQVVYCGNSRIPYTEYNLDAILKLEPYQRWNLVAKSSLDDSKPKYNQDCFSPAEIREILRNRNFDAVAEQLNEITNTPSLQLNDMVNRVYNVMRKFNLNTQIS